MQDRFVGDVGDFGKYGLLRALTGIHPHAEPRLSLGVVWYVPSGPVGSLTDGKHTDYLQKPDVYRGCDPDLFDRLGKITSAERKLGTVQESDVLGNTTTFFGDPIPPDRTHREQWIARALHTVETNDIVFLDPDNGLAPPSASQTSPQHAYLSEGRGLCEAWTDGHHLPPPWPNLGGWRGIAPRTDAVLGRESQVCPPTRQIARDPVVPPWNRTGLLRSARPRSHPHHREAARRIQGKPLGQAEALHPAPRE